MLLLSKDRNAIIETEYLTAHCNDPITGVAKIEQVIKHMLYIYKNDVQEYDYMQDDIPMAKRCAAGFGITEWDDDYLITEKYKSDPIIKVKIKFNENDYFNNEKRFCLNKGVAEFLSTIKIDDKFFDCIAIMDKELEVIPNKPYELNYLLVNPAYALPNIKPDMQIDLGTLLYEATGTILEIKNAA